MWHQRSKDYSDTIWTVSAFGNRLLVPEVPGRYRSVTWRLRRTESGLTTGEFGDAVAVGSGPAVVKAPIWVLGGAAVCALASFGLLAVGSHWAHWAGYVLGTAGTILFVALFRMSDASKSTDPRYSRVAWTGVSAGLILLLGIVGGCANIYYLAQRIS